MSKDLTTGDSADIDVVTENGDVGGWDRERNLGKGRVQRFNANDLVLLLREAESTKETVDFHLGVGWPNTNVVTMLIRDSRTFNTKFNMNAVPVTTDLEKFTRSDDRCGIWILSVVNTLGLGKSAGGKFTCNSSLTKETEAGKGDLPR